MDAEQRFHHRDVQQGEGIVRPLVFGIAFLAGFAFSAGFANAQETYGVGGYLERPELPDEEEPPQAENGDNARPAQRPLNQRPNSPQRQTQQAPPPSQYQQPTGAMSGDGSTQPRRNRQNAATIKQVTPREPRRTRTLQRSSTQETNYRDTSDELVPPLPWRRPDFADVALPGMAALAGPDAETPITAPASAPPAPNAVETEPAMEAETPPAAEPVSERVATEADTAPAPPSDAVPEPQAAALAPAEQAAVDPVHDAAANPSAPPELPAQEAAAPALEQAPEAAAASAPPAPVTDAQPLAPSAETNSATAEGPVPAEAAASAPAQQAALDPAPPAAPTPPQPEPLAASAEPGPPPLEAAPIAAAPLPASSAEPALSPQTQSAPSDAGVAPGETASPGMPQADPTPPAPDEAAPLPAASAPAVEDAAVEQKMAAMPETTAPVASAATPAQPEIAAETTAPAPLAPAPVAAAEQPIVEAQLQARPTPAAANAQAVPQPPQMPANALEKMIGQMLVVGFRGLTPEDAWPQKIASQIKAGTIGGVLFMSHNVQSPQQLKTLTSFLQRAKGDIPVFYAVDQEGGIVQRLSAEKGFQEFPTATKIGQSNDPLTAYTVYKRMALELSQYGFNMNMGPVVDLHRNDASPIIAGKQRSFGFQPKHVAAFAKAFCIAHQDQGVLTVLKHFPGHGSTPFDTHTQPVDVGGSWDKAELEPYRDLIASRTAQAIMTGHIAHPSFSEEPGLPASLSRKAIRQLLRGELGYDGVVISDDLEMGAIRSRFSLEDSAVRAVKAGNDILILSNQNAPAPDLPERLIAAIKKAVESGAISRDELQASYDRILVLKQRLQNLSAAKPGGPGKRTSASAEGDSATPAR